jgi:hypothetical protein
MMFTGDYVPTVHSLPTTGSIRVRANDGVHKGKEGLRVL